MKKGLFGLLFFWATVAMAAVGTQLVSSIAPDSIRPAGGNGPSIAPQITPDGRWILFTSSASDLTTNVIGNFACNLFLHDRTSNTTTLVSANLNGAGGNGDSLYGQISTNGRYVVFQSDASDLVTGDTNGVGDIFVRDLQAGTNILVSVAADGSCANGESSDPVISQDGHYVVFVSSATNLVSSDTNNFPDLFLRDLLKNTTVCVTAGATGSNAIVSSPVITPDGRYVAFFSTANGLANGVSKSTGGEIYRYDSGSHQIIWVSTNAASIASEFLQLTNSPSTHPAISDDGRYVAFKTGWTNGTVLYSGGSGTPAVIYFQYDALNNSTTILSTNGYAPWAGNDDVYGPEMTSDGRFVALVQREQSGSTNYPSIQLWDRQAGTNMLVNTGLDGLWPTNSASDTPVLSEDGRFVTFLSDANNLVSQVVSNGFHIYRRDLQTETTELLDADTNGVGSMDELGAIPSMCGDGSEVTFASPDGALVAADDNNEPDIFLWDAATGTNALVSAHASLSLPQSGNRISAIGPLSISSDGGLVAFASFASDLVTNDFNGDADVFVHDLTTDNNILASVGLDGSSAQGGASTDPILSANGRFVIFASGATNLVAEDTSSEVDIFRRDLQTETTTWVSDVATVGSPRIYDANHAVSSPNGRYVAFLCRTNTSTAITALFWRDMNSSLAHVVSGNVSNQNISISSDGMRLAYIGNPSSVNVWDADSQANIFSTTASSLTSAVISPTGNRLLYQASGRLIVYDLINHSNLFTCVSSVPIETACPWSGDGRYVTFVTSTNLVTSDTNGTDDVYLLDLQDNHLTLVSADSGGNASTDGYSDSPVISEDGRFVAFRTFATNLVSGIIRPPSMVLFDRLGGTNTLLATGSINSQQITWLTQPHLSTDASHLTFENWNGADPTRVLNRTGNVFANTLANWIALDVDADGIPDWWMIQQFGHATGQTNDSTQAWEDMDHDGMNNLQEFLAGTLPTDPTSFLSLDVAPDTGPHVRLNWMASPGKAYQILSATNLTGASWSVMPDSIPAGAAAEIGGRRQFSVPATNGQQFFRIQTGN